MAVSPWYPGSRSGPGDSGASSPPPDFALVNKGDREADDKVLRAVSSMFFNTVATVGIVVVNKALFSHYDLAFAPTTLLTLHQLVCLAGAYAVPPGEPLSPVKKNSLRVSIYAIVFTRMASNVFSTLSLKYNPVGMYQLYKMLSLPCVFVGELVFFAVPFRASIALTLIALVVGLALATVNDVSFNLLGALCGCCAPLASSSGSLVVKHVQSRYNVVGNDLLRAIALPLVLCHVPVIFMTDDVSRIPEWCRNAGGVGLGLVLLTCLIAWAMEWTYLLVMHYTSAMSMQVLGHMKTMLIIASGVVFFHNPIAARSGAGIAVAMAAAGAYTYLKAPPISWTDTWIQTKEYCFSLKGAVTLLLVGAVLAPFVSNPLHWVS